MSKYLLTALLTLALSGCATVSWKHSSKGYGKVSTLSTKGSAGFLRDYQDCDEIATRYADDHESPYNPCIAAREHTRCMKEKYGWEIDKSTGI